jgi:hypothetical protein
MEFTNPQLSAEAKVLTYAIYIPSGQLNLINLGPVNEKKNNTVYSV